MQCIESLTNGICKRLIISNLISVNFFLFPYLQRYFCRLVFFQGANNKIVSIQPNTFCLRSIRIVGCKLLYYFLSSFCSRINHVCTVQNQRSILCAEGREIKGIDCICEVGKCRVSYCFCFQWQDCFVIALFLHDCLTVESVRL